MRNTSKSRTIESPEPPAAKLNAVVKSKIVVYYFGKFDASPFEMKELMKPLRRCRKEEHKAFGRQKQRA